MDQGCRAPPNDSDSNSINSSESNSYDELKETFDAFVISSGELEKELEIEIELKTKKIKELSSECAFLRSRSDTQHDSIRKSSIEIESLQGKLEQLKNEAAQRKEENRMYENLIDSLESQLRQSQASVIILQDKLKTAVEQRIFAESQLEDMRERWLDRDNQEKVMRESKAREKDCMLNSLMLCVSTNMDTNLSDPAGSEATFPDTTSEFELKSSIDQEISSLKDDLQQANLAIKELTSKNKSLAKELEDVRKEMRPRETVGQSSFLKDIVLNDTESTRILKEELMLMCQRYEAEKNANIANMARLQEATGNIKVLCRIRPSNLSESNAGAEIMVSPLNSTDICFMDKRTGQLKSSTFDRVLGSDANQLEVFSELEPLALSVADGFNAAIICYGQTGSGKTFTMVGNDSNGIATHGLTYHVLHKLFDTIKRRLAASAASEALMNSEASESYEAKVKIGMIEIYNEEIVDLLASPQSPANGTRSTESSSKSKLFLRADTAGRTDVVGLSWIELSDADEAIKIFNTGNQKRTTGSTLLNSESSRSHSVLMVDVSVKSSLRESNLTREKRALKVTTSRLFLVDLAGSERVKMSGVTGKAMKEATHINSSLSSLGDVMYSLESKAKHIPYRNSKLTYLLSNALASGSRTALCINVAPTEHTLDETVNTIMFANRVRKISLGTPLKSQGSFVMKNMQDEVDSLRSQLEEANHRCNDYQKVIHTMRYTEQEKTNMSIELESRRLDVNSSWLSAPTGLSQHPDSIALTPRTGSSWLNSSIHVRHLSRSATVTRARIRAEEAVKKHQQRVKEAKTRRS